MAVSAPAVTSTYVLFMNGNGTVKSHHQLGGPADTVFGGAVAALGDIDGDSVTDLAIAADLCMSSF